MAFYVLDSKPKLNDNQPDLLLDDDLSDTICLYPKTIPLMSSNEKLKRCNIKRVVRYHTPNRFTNLEAYAHHLLMLFFPFRKELDLISQIDSSYVAMLHNENVLAIVNNNKVKFEPWGDIVDSVLMNNIFSPRTDQFAEQENHNVEDEFENQSSCDDESEIGESADFPSHSQNTTPSRIHLMPDENINELIRTLNIRQCKIFDMIYTWAKTYIKNLSSVNQVANPPLQLFVTGGAGTGKSHLIKTIYASVSKTLAYGSSHIEKPTVLLLAPTGVAAINVNGTTIHSALGIPIECRGFTVPRLADKKRCSLRLELSNVKLLIIDEISMVSNKLLLFVHQRLIEIFGCVSDFHKPFAGISVVLVGDLYQLPPVLQRPVYAEFHNELLNISRLWRNFKMCELSEVMRQKGDSTLIDLLNNVRLGIVTCQDEQLLKSKFIENTDINYPVDALHIFAENEPARCHNKNMLNRIDNPSVLLEATDQIPQGVPNYVYDKILNLSQGKTGGLAYKLVLKIGARVMLTSNIDVKDKLINGQIGTVINFLFHNNTLKTIYVKFDDETAGIEKRRNDNLVRQYNAVPIEQICVDIRTNEKKLTSPIIKRTQFPLMLSWACTVHKVQGLSLNQLVVSFDLLKQRAFNYGQIYVALSRVTSLEGLFLTGKFHRQAICADKKAIDEYEYLRENQSMVYEKVFTNNNHDTLTISLCNVRSLRLHVRDIQTDDFLVSSDLILCTETQLLNDDDSDIQINQFSLITNNCPKQQISELSYLF